MTSDLIRRNIWWTAKNKNLDFSMIRSSKIAILKVVDRAENILSARINDRQKSGDRKDNVIKLRLFGIENHPTTIFSKSRVAFLLKNDHVLSIRHGHKGQPPFRETALWYGI